MKEVMNESDTAPPELLERAQCLVRTYPECFWSWRDAGETKIDNLPSVRLVIKNLREHGGHKAWREAQELQQCLLQSFKEAS